MKLISFKRIVLGEFTANQFSIFEHKRLFSIIIYYFKGNGWQDRFHTHAFNAISIKVFGNYSERILTEKKTETYHQVIRSRVFKYFPKSTYHMLGKSSGCLTILFSGPWDSTWKEFKGGEEFELTWGRKKSIVLD